MQAPDARYGVNRLEILTIGELGGFWQAGLGDGVLILGELSRLLQ